MGKDSRITMADVSEVSPEEAWSQADQWAKMEKEGFKVTRKSIQNLAKVASLNGEATELTMVKALRQRTERQFAAGKLRDTTRDDRLGLCNQAEKEEVNLFLIPVKSITGEMVIDWFTGFCESKGKPTANKWAVAFQTAYSDLLTLKVLKGENPFKVLSGLKLTSKTNTDKNPVKPEDRKRSIQPSIHKSSISTDSSCSLLRRDREWVLQEERDGQRISGQPWLRNLSKAA